MASTSPSELAARLLRACLAGEPFPEDALDSLAAAALDPRPGTAAEAANALFGGLAEPLADLFEPRFCEAYAALFSRIFARALPPFSAGQLESHYQAVRLPRRIAIEPARVLVLSRVTLGADIAVTSVLLDAARQRFPRAELIFAGPQKNWELFERAPRLRHLPVSYPRQGALAGRLGVFHTLCKALAAPDSIVLDPDSRLSQLGLLPLCPPERHFLFESRGYGGDSEASLTALAQDWARCVLEVEDAVPWMHPRFSCDFGSQPVATVSLGVGENPAKRVEDPFEEELLALLSERKGLVMIDAGAPGSEEEERVRRAAEAARARGARIGIHEGSFASFAAMIAASDFYAGYDSAGQHAAAAAGVPQVCVFRGYACARAVARWAPDGPAPSAVVPGEGKSVAEILTGVRRALD